MRSKKIIKIIVIAILSSLIAVSIFMIGRLSHVRIVYLDLEESAINEFSTNNKYDFMPVEIGNYIVQLSNSLDVDPDLVVAILMQENPKFNAGAENRNKNGTCDIGLFQLNNKYLYTDFEPKYWLEDGPELNPFNWKHNTFIAIHLIRDLTKSLKIQDEAIMAYNCGKDAVINNRIPAETYLYLAAVKNNLTLIKRDAEKGL